MPQNDNKRQQFLTECLVQYSESSQGQEGGDSTAFPAIFYLISGFSDHLVS